MTGPGDVGGEVSGEEAAWRDLIAHYDMADELSSGASPWPERENLTEAGTSGRGAVEEGTPGPGPAEPGASSARPSASGQPGSGPTGLGPSGLGPSGLGSLGSLGSSGLGPSAAGPARGQDGSAQQAFDGYSPADRTRLIRPAGDPRSYSPPEDADDQAYIPPPLPPPAKLDPIAKAAWAGLIGGPAYLLIGVLVGWTISGIAAFAAIAAFVTGFVILVLRLGDGSKRDDDDDGAVV
jgi:hypothetical protein